MQVGDTRTYSQQKLHRLREHITMIMIALRLKPITTSNKHDSFYRPCH